MTRLSCSLLAVLIACSTASAQWSTALWPSTNHPGPDRFVPQLWECYSGIVERAVAVGYTNNLSVPVGAYWSNGLYRATNGAIIGTNFYVRCYPTWQSISNVPNNAEKIRNIRVAVIEYKRSVGLLAAQYLNNNFPTNDTTPFNTNYPDQHSAATLCRELLVPANFFTYTPYRMLSSYPYEAITNSSTAAGGTNYPPGRTNWITADYGIDGLQRAITALRFRMYDVNAVSAGAWEGACNTNTLAAAKAGAIADLHASAFPTNGQPVDSITAYGRTAEYSGQSGAGIIAETGLPYTYGLPTNAATVYMYIGASRPLFAWGNNLGYGIEQTYGQGTGLEEFKWKLWDTLQVENVTSATGRVIAVSSPAAMEWPTGTTLNEWYFRGFCVAFSGNITFQGHRQSWAVVDFTPGFRFK